MWDRSRDNISTVGAWVLIIGVLGFLVGMASMLPLASMKEPLMTFSMVAVGAATGAYTALTWHARENFFVWGRSVVYAERPTSYHFVAALGMGFSLALLIAGVHLAWAQIASAS